MLRTRMACGAAIRSAWFSVTRNEVGVWEEGVVVLAYFAGTAPRIGVNS